MLNHHPNKIVANREYILEQKAISEKINKVKSRLVTENRTFIDKLHKRNYNPSTLA
jgi:hypothetical protein